MDEDIAPATGLDAADDTEVSAPDDLANQEGRAIEGVI